jgi:hypothetical protein
MPWVPELFSAPVLQQVLDQRRRDALVAVPYYDGLLTGELDALIESFAGEPELHDPMRGRVRGVEAFTAFVADTRAWLAHHHVRVEDLGHVILDERGFEEVVLHLEAETGPVDLPVAVVADHVGNRLTELRVYSSSWPLTGRHVVRPPLLQADPDLQLPDVVGAYQRALADGDVEAAVATFVTDGYVREPSGGEHVHTGPDELRRLHEVQFSNGGGIALEHCAVADDGRTCALEYNAVRWGETDLAPQAGVAVHVRGHDGLEAVRIYDDVDPPLSWGS